MLSTREQGDLLAHAGLARTRHADQGNVLLAAGQTLCYVQDALARGDLAGIALDGLCRLGHEHQQAADAGDTAALGLEHQARAGGVVDNVDNAFERIEPFERARRVGAMGEHAGGRAVDE